MYLNPIYTCVENPDEIGPMFLFHISDFVIFLFSYPPTPPENCTLPLTMTAYQVAPPNISCVFEDGIGCGPLSVPLDTIAELKPNITDNKDGTFNYEVVPDIPVSYSTY